MIQYSLCSSYVKMLQPLDLTLPLLLHADLIFCHVFMSHVSEAFSPRGPVRADLFHHAQPRKDFDSRFRRLIPSISLQLPIVWDVHLNDSDAYGAFQRQKKGGKKTWQNLTPRLALTVPQ